ncbi:MAG: hypothetical protein HY243_15640 [Proteobacteria bacterium]|nr:hypothetical protein [Pseudomonadota bacterium]
MVIAHPSMIVPDILIVEIVHPRTGTDWMTLRDPLDLKSHRTYHLDSSLFSTLRTDLAKRTRKVTPQQPGYMKVSDKANRVTPYIFPELKSVQTIGKCVWRHAIS